MARTMSSAALAAISAQQTSEVFLYLLDIVISVGGVSTPYRFVNDFVPLVRKGNRYDPLGFKITLPQEGENIQGAKVTIDAVDRRIIQVLREADTMPKVSFILILASNPDGDPEAGPFIFDLSNVSYNKTSLSADLSIGNHLDGVFPRVIKTPYFFPALF